MLAALDLACMPGGCCDVSLSHIILYADLHTVAGLSKPQDSLQINQTVIPYVLSNHHWPCITHGAVQEQVWFETQYFLEGSLLDPHWTTSFSGLTDKRSSSLPHVQSTDAAFGVAMQEGHKTALCVFLVDNHSGQTALPM